MPSYKLYYFPIRARGELPRYLFAEAGVAYEDIRVPFTDWQKEKQNQPFCQLPVLEVDGKQLAQGYAIARYLATEFGLLGKDKWEVALADMYTGVVEDLFAPVNRIRYEQNKAVRAENFKKYIEETGPMYLQAIDRDLSKSSSGFLVGNGLTYADLALYSLFEFVEPTLGDEGKALTAKFPNIGKFRQKIEALPKIAAWINKRPPTDY